MSRRELIDAAPIRAAHERGSSSGKWTWQKLEPAERSRTYIYANVTDLKVSESGKHYLNANGVKAIVAPGWRAIELDMDSWTF